MSCTRQHKERSALGCLDRQDDTFPGSAQINLLEKVGQLGSITRAAKAMGICYKTAWDTINGINTRAGEALVKRQTGGRGGGGSCLTEEGEKVVAQFRAMQEERRRFMENQEERFGYTESIFNFLRRSSPGFNAPNTFSGTVSFIEEGVVYSDVTLTLEQGISLRAVVSNAAILNLQLVPGMQAHAIVKPASVIVASGLHEARITAGNLFPGTVASLRPGEASSEIEIAVGEGLSICAIVTHGSSHSLGLRQGEPVCALFEASHVILGVN